MSKASPPPKGDLPRNVILRAIQGDPKTVGREAFSEVYRHYAHRVEVAVVWAGLKMGYLRGVGTHERTERRDDLVQEVWARLLDRDRYFLRPFDPARGTFGGFIFRLAYQQALYCLHRRAWGEAMVGYDMWVDEHEMDLAARMIHSDLFAKFLRRAKKELNEIEMKLIEEHHLKGETLRAVAPMLGMSEGALQKRNKKLLEKLESIIDQLHDHSSVLPSSAVAILLLVLSGLV